MQGLEPVGKSKTGRPPLYFGWYVLATTIFIGIVTTGAGSSFGIFVVPLEKEFGWDRFTVTLAVSLGALVNGVTQPFLGRAFDVLGARKVILVSLSVYGLAITLLSLTFHLLFLVFILGFVAPFALSGTSLTNTGALVAKWFQRKRATVVGFNAAGLSSGGLLLVPFAMYVLQATNWRIAWAALGLIILVLAVPMAFLFIRDDPAKLGLQPDGEAAVPDEVTSETSSRHLGPLEIGEPGMWARSLRSWPLWQMSGSYAVCGFTTFILSVHFVPYAIDQGIAPGTAATIFGFMMGLNLLGTTGAGMLADRIGGRKNVLALVYLLRGGAYVLLLLVPSTMGLWAFAAVAGFSWVATASLTTTLTAEVYGLRALGTVSGLSLLMHQIGGSASVVFAALLYDLTGSYTIPFAVAGALLFPAALSAFSINERRYSIRYQEMAPATAAD